MKRSAVISVCGKYRYELRRIWDESSSLVLFICLNPSTANATSDDPTSRKCIHYARRWGYGGLLLGNLFAFRSTEPSQLTDEHNPVGSENDKHLKKMKDEADLVICAWGDGGRFCDRDKQVLSFLKNPFCLVKLESGRPGHPLYKNGSLSPIPLFAK